MKSLKGTKTEQNILTAFAGESQARNRYDYFSSEAKKEGLIQIADVFAETALQEKEHAKRLFKFLEGGEVEIQAAYPAGTIEKTELNLISSAKGENYEHTEMYPQFAQIAEKEGFSEVAHVMRSIANAEAYHEKRFLAHAKNIKEGKVFEREIAIVWHCKNCGYVHDGKTAPEKCPACAHPKAYFEALHNCW